MFSLLVLQFMLIVLKDCEHFLSSEQLNRSRSNHFYLFNIHMESCFTSVKRFFSTWLMLHVRGFQKRKWERKDILRDREWQHWGILSQNVLNSEWKGTAWFFPLPWHGLYLWDFLTSLSPSLTIFFRGIINGTVDNRQFSERRHGIYDSSPFLHNGNLPNHN